MTREDLRDQFAMAALAGALTRHQFDGVDIIAEQAYDIADAMMDERARRTPPRERPAPTAIPGEGT